jgi:hypothetical protein
VRTSPKPSPRRDPHKPTPHISLNGRSLIPAAPAPATQARPQTPAAQTA